VPVAPAGGFAGMLAGLILINPLLSALGGIAGAALGALKEVPIDEEFIKKLSEDLKPGSSALFVAARKGEPETIIEALETCPGQVLRTSLSHRAEDKLRTALKKVNEFRILRFLFAYIQCWCAADIHTQNFGPKYWIDPMATFPVFF